MDADQFATEASNSPGSASSSSSTASYSSSPRLPDFEIEAPIKMVGENGKIDSNGSDDDENDEDVEFVSGGEEFEEEPLAPAEESEDKGDDSEAPFVDSSGLSTGIALPVARASTIDSDDDDDIVGGSKVGQGGDVEDGEDVLWDGSDKGLKIFGVSESVESVVVGEVGVEEAPERVVVARRLGENGGLAELVNGSGGAKDSLERIDGVLLGGEQDKVLEVPNSGLVGALVSEETNVTEDKGEDEVNTGSSTGLEVQENGKGVEEAASLASGFDKVDPEIVEPVNEKLEEPDVMERDGQGGRVVEAGGSVTEENGVPEKVEDEGTQVKDGVDVEEGKMEGTTLGSGINEVEPVTEKLGEPDVMEQDGQGKGVVEVGGSVTEENGVPEKVEDEGTEVKDGVVVEEGKVEDTTLGSGINEVEPVIVESVTEKFGEPEGVELAGKGDTVVEAIHVNLLPSGAAVVGDEEENKLYEVKEDGLVDTPVNVDNVFNHISPDAEEPEKIAELNESNGPETNAAVVGKGTDQNTSSVEEETSDVLAGDESTSVLQVKEKGEVVEEGITLGGGIDEVDPMVGSVTVEPVNEKLEEPDVMGLAGKEESVVEAIHVNLLTSGAAVIGDVEENKLSAIKEMDSLVVAPANVNNVFDQIRSDAEEPEKIAELAMSKIPETIKVGLNESNGLEKDASAVGKGDVQHTDVATKVVQDCQKMEACDDENQAADLTVKEKPPMEVDLRADSDTERSERVVDAAVEKEELLSSNKIDGGDGDGTKVHSYHAEPMSSDAMDSAELTNGDRIILNSQGEELEGKANTTDSLEMTSLSNSVDRPGEEDEEKENIEEEGKLGDPVGDEEDESMIFGSSEAAKQFLEGLERRSGVGSHSGESSQSHDHSQRIIDGQIVTDSEEEADTDAEDDGKEMFDSAALAALLKAATGADTEDGSITITSKDGSKLFSVERPAGLGSSLRPKPPTSWPNRSNLFSQSTLSTGGETEINLSDEEKQKLEKLQQIRIKFLRLVQRLGYSPEDQIAAQVLYRLSLVAGRQTNQLFSLDAAKRTAFQLEEEGKDDLNFSLNILVLGKTGVGKSSTINSIFGEAKSQIDAFGCATTAIKEFNGTVGGVKIRVFDTPGLKSSVLEQGYNRKVLSSVKKFTKKSPPDIVLYVDRLDTQTRDLNDFPMLKTITSTLGPSIWRSAIVALTHAASAPPDGPTGNPLSYEVFVAQRSHIVQQSIGQAVGDLRMMSASSMNPVSLVENHPSCRKNREGLKVLPNGQTWKPQLLFLSYSMKILSEASSLSKPQDPFDHKKLFGFRARSPPLPYLLSWLLQSRTHPKLLTDQSRNDVDSDIFDDEVDEEEEDEEEEYDQLPPFRPLTKEQLKKLTREQRNAYFDEYEYRVKLLQKKQWKEMKKGNAGTDEMGAAEGDADEADNANEGMVSVPLPDMVLPHSFDGDSPAYRYRFLDPQSHLLTRPVLDTHGWDHDCGYDGVNIENRALAIKNQYPASIAVQITKDKKEFNIHLDSSISAKHGEKGSSMVGFDIQNVGKQLAYIVRAESKFKNHRRNKTTAGASVTFLGENIATGVKVEDQLALGKRFLLTGSTGTVRSKSDAAYGANLEVQLREADYPIGQDQSSLGLSLVKWRGDLALGANLQSQVTVGRGSKVTLRAGLNNKRSGQISVSLNSTEQLQLALIGIIPLARAIYKTLSQGAGAGGDNYSLY